jgi:hypothetical protein
MSLWGAQIEALKSISCSFLGEGLGKIKSVVGGLTDTKLLGRAMSNSSKLLG